MPCRPRVFRRLSGRQFGMGSVGRGGWVGVLHADHRTPDIGSIARYRIDFNSHPWGWNVAAPTLDDWKQMYHALWRIRLFEAQVQRLAATGEVPGFPHLSTGQEAVA